MSNTIPPESDPGKGAWAEAVRATASRCLGQSIPEEEAKILVSSYLALARTLADFSGERLRWVEPAFHSVSAREPEEQGP